jgi:hypothetical protein
MSDTHYVEPTGLSSRNQSSAQDLVLLVKEASPAAPDPRAVDVARGAGAGGQPRAAVPQHQWAGAQPRVGDRPAEDRLHLRSRPLRRDAGAVGRAQADHGAARLGRQVLAHRRRRAHPPLAEPERGPRAPAEPPERGMRAERGSAAMAQRRRDLRRRGLDASPARLFQPSAGAETDSPATSLPWSSKMPAAMQRTPSSSSSSSRASADAARTAASSRSRRVSR